MTDPLTDAVKRLKRLQQDVERLKAGQDEEGEPRLFVTAQEVAVASDSIEIAAEDVLAVETALAVDAIRFEGETVRAGVWTGLVPQTAGYGAESYGDNYGSPPAPEPTDRGWGTIAYADSTE